MESQSPDDREHDGAQHDDALLPRLTLIEQQPLDTRADAYGHLHEQLRARLEGGDQPERHG